MNLLPEIAAEPPRRAMGSHQSRASKTNTWLTPPQWISALGPFDLDPCACPAPRPWPTAAMMWTREDSPLSRTWPPSATVWLNPPFAPAPVLAAFLERGSRHPGGCMALLFARTDTRIWQEAVFPRAAGILFVQGRPHFHHQDGRRAAGNSGAPVALIAYGEAMASRLASSGIPGAFRS